MIPNISVNTYYIRHSRLPIEEDLNHEFKGHRCLSYRDLSEKTMTLGWKGRENVRKIVHSRRPISGYLCGMLNTGLGGTFYLGVEDMGKVEGLMMSASQMEHVLLQIKDLFDSYQPPVPDHMYNVKFIPIVDASELHSCRSLQDDHLPIGQPRPALRSGSRPP